MKIFLLFFSLAYLLLQSVTSINPFHVLQLEEGATEEQIRERYKILRKNAKGNDIKLKLLKDAFQQIMLDSTLEMTLPKQSKKQSSKSNRRNRRRRRGLPRLSDMFRHDYFVSPKQKLPQKSPSQRAFEIQDEKNFINQRINENQQRLPTQFDDPSYNQSQKRVQQTISDENVAFNIKAARFILFIGGILLKLTPCFCLYMIFKYRKQNPKEQEGENNPFTKAMNGWAGKGRRIGGTKKAK